MIGQPFKRLSQLVGMSSNILSDALLMCDVGYRACGRNLALLELQIIIASIFRRFQFVLQNPELPVCSFSFLGSRER